MKRFLLLALTAGLLSPIGAKAEVIYLDCYGEALLRRQPITYFTATINENTGTAVVDGGTAKLLGAKVASRGIVVSTPSQFVISTSFWGDMEDVITINRYNGTYLMRRQNQKFTHIGDDLSKGTCTKQTPTNRAF